MSMGRGDAIAQAVLLVDAVDATGDRGIDFEQLASAMHDFRLMSGRTLGTERVRRQVYRLMDALEASGSFEVLDKSNGKARQRVRRIRSVHTATAS